MRLDVKKFRSTRAYLQVLTAVLVATGGRAHSATCESVFTESLFSARAENGIAENLGSFATRYGVKFDSSYRGQRRFPRELRDPNYPLEGSVSLSTAVSNGAGTVDQHLTFISKGEGTGRIVTTRPVPESGLKRLASLGDEIWKLGAERFRFFNPSRIALDETSVIAEAHAKAEMTARTNPGTEIRVPLHPVWATAKRLIEDRQVRASTLGIRNYDGRKSYLSGEDRFDLRLHDLTHPNLNDFHMLLIDSGRSSLELNPDEFEQAMAVMMRVSRYQPDQEEAISPIFEGFARELPHSSRLRSKIRDLVRLFFDQMSVEGRLRIAEFSRFNRLQDVSSELMDAFVLNAFLTTAASAPVDIFILGCDDVTRRLFSAKYGFEDLVKISEGDTNSEYLMYLDTRTSRYRDVVRRLSTKSSRVDRMAEKTMVPVDKWKAGWEEPSQFWDYSGFHKRQYVENVFSSSRAKFRSNFRSQKSASVVRRKATESISASSGTARARSQALTKISKRDQRSLLEKFSYFAEPVEAVAKHIGVNSGSKDRILLIGPSAEFFATLLKRQYSTRTIDIESDLSFSEFGPTYDRIIVLGSYSGNSRVLQRRFLVQAARALRTDGTLTIVDSVLPFYRQGRSVSRGAPWKRFVSETVEQGLPFPSDQLASALLLFRRSFFIGKFPLEERLLLEDLAAAGFTTNHFIGFATSIENFRGITLIRP